jgi:hypothetical protein
MIHQVASILGAALVLGAYLGLQRGWLNAHSRRYNALNFVGAGLLFWIAVVDQRAGFIMVEGAWALLSVPGLLKSKGKSD